MTQVLRAARLVDAEKRGLQIEYRVADEQVYRFFHSLRGLAEGLAGFATGAALLGVGTAMVYPTLLAAIGDVAHPSWRASSVGVYRLWRDLGYAIGALLAGVVADALGVPAAMWVIAALTFASGLLVALRMKETLVREGR